MFARFRRARLDPAIPSTLYGAIVAQARTPALYTDLGVPDTVEGRCPDVLRDFLEVRGIGILNIRTIFGETAIRPRKLLRLIVHLEDHGHETFSELDRLKVDATFHDRHQCGFWGGTALGAVEPL